MDMIARLVLEVLQRAVQIRKEYKCEAVDRHDSAVARPVGADIMAIKGPEEVIRSFERRAIYNEKDGCYNASKFQRDRKSKRCYNK